MLLKNQTTLIVYTREDDTGSPLSEVLQFDGVPPGVPRPGVPSGVSPTPGGVRPSALPLGTSVDNLTRLWTPRSEDRKVRFLIGYLLGSWRRKIIVFIISVCQVCSDIGYWRSVVPVIIFIRVSFSFFSFWFNKNSLYFIFDILTFHN
jgi:hypothetical protein